MQSIHMESIRILENMMDTFRERNTTYGENYLILGNTMAAMFPNGITLRTPEDFVKYHFLDWHVGKLTRYVQTGMCHVDSVKDGGVYCAMLAAWSSLHDNQERHFQRVSPIDESNSRTQGGPVAATGTHDR